MKAKMHFSPSRGQLFDVDPLPPDAVEIDSDMALVLSLQGLDAIYAHLGLEVPVPRDQSQPAPEPENPEVILWSKSRRAFYSSGLVYSDLPDDVVEVDAAKHAAVITGQAAGGRLDVGPDGDPVIVLADNQPTRADVNRERNRRITSGFLFGGKHYDFDPASQQRVAGAAQWAALAIGQGAQAGDLLWRGGTTPFGFIAADNSLTEMDAQTVVQLGMTAAAHVERHVMAARAIKAMDPLPDDFADDSRWP